MDTAALAQSILDTHHALLHRELPRLAAVFRDQPEELRAPFMRLKQVMDEHMMKEEQILFPLIITLAQGGGNGGCGVEGPIAQMGVEHNAIRLLEDEIRGASSLAGAEEEALMALLDDLSEHARKEDESLFPSALALAREASARPAPAAGLTLVPKPTPAAPKPTPPVTPATATPASTSAAPRRKHTATSALPPKPQAGRTIRETRGACPSCFADVPAAVIVRNGEALLEKRCPTHGPSTQLLSRHPDLWTELDRFYFSVNDDAYPQRDFIVRMTEKCNLACPICLAKANTEDTPDLDLSGLETLLSERRGIKIDLMAAEPTLRADLEGWIRKVKDSGNIAALHTNGIKLADLGYARRLAEAGVDEVFLQFDGLDDKANTTLRGRPLLKARLAALANLRTLGIATSLIVVIAGGLNEAQVGETFHFALRPENRHIREVFFLGLRSMGSARQHAADGDTDALAGQTLMPDALIDELCEQVPAIRRRDVHDFNMVYFAMLSAFRVKKCLYIQHYLVARDGKGGFVPISEIVDLRKMANAAQRYAVRRKSNPILARAGFGTSVLRLGLRRSALKMGADLLRLEKLFATGMNLGQVPSRFLLVGFITACDLDNFDAGVSVNCGKGELSADGGFTESSAVANVAREARFAETARPPGPAWRAPARDRA